MSRPRNSESVFRAIADPTRRRILDLLQEEPRSVGDLVRILRLTRPRASHHLGALVQAGLIRQQRRGREMDCTIDARPLGAAHAWLAKHLHRQVDRTVMH